MSISFGTLQAQVQQLMGALAGKSFRTGSGSSVFTASSSAADVTVTHNLGRVPSFARATATNSGIVEWWVPSKSSTSVTFRGYITTGATFTGTITFDWLVVG